MLLWSCLLSQKHRKQQIFRFRGRGLILSLQTPSETFNLPQRHHYLEKRLQLTHNVPPVLTLVRGQRKNHTPEETDSATETMLQKLAARSLFGFVSLLLLEMNGFLSQPGWT